MENNKPSNRIHPLVAGAAISVMLVSLTGVAAITGLIPNSHSSNSPAAENTAASPASPSTQVPVAGSVGAATAATSPANLLEPKTAAVDEPPAAESKPVAAQQRPHTAHTAKAAHTQPRTSYAESTAVAQAPDVCNSCGRIESVQAVQQAAKPSGLGVVAGAVLGGVLGNQVGNGNGRTLATVAGAVGGGYAGNEVEKRTHTTTTYQVRVRMDDGSIRTFPYTQQPAWSAGDRVRVVDGHLTSRA